MDMMNGAADISCLLFSTSRLQSLLSECSRGNTACLFASAHTPCAYTGPHLNSWPKTNRILWRKRIKLCV